VDVADRTAVSLLAKHTVVVLHRDAIAVRKDPELLVAPATCRGAVLTLLATGVAPTLPAEATKIQHLVHPLEDGKKTVPVEWYVSSMWRSLQDRPGNRWLARYVIV
jgi:hypothetical protein